MAGIFWDQGGVLLAKWLPSKQTITAQYYIGVLEELRERIKAERRAAEQGAVASPQRTPSQ